MQCKKVPLQGYFCVTSQGSAIRGIVFSLAVVGMYHATSQDFQIVVNLVRVSTETVQQMIDSKHLRLSLWHCSIYGAKPWWVKVIQISQHLQWKKWLFFNLVEL